MVNFEFKLKYLNYIINRKINKDILKVVEEVWEKGGGMLDIPSREDVEIPSEGSEYFKVQAINGVLYATVINFLLFNLRKNCSILVNQGLNG